MKKLLAMLALGAFLVSVGVGCSSPTTPAKAAPDNKAKTEGDKKTTP